MGGSVQEFNATFALSGAAGILETAQRETGIPVHHYLQIDFVGFAGIVDAVGGIQMTFPFPARDLKSGFDTPAGIQVLDGATALVLARSRGYQELRNSEWVSIDANDIGRIARQQDLLFAMVTQIDRPSIVAGYGELLDAFGEFVIVDNTFDSEDIIQLAWGLRSIDSDDLESVTLPVDITSEGGLSYVVERQPEANGVINGFLASESIAVAAPSIRVEVQNGNGRAGAAAAMMKALTGLGYEVVSVVNSARSDYETTLVISRPTLLTRATDLVTELGYGRPTIGRIPSDVGLVVIVGSDVPVP